RRWSAERVTQKGPNGSHALLDGEWRDAAAEKVIAVVQEQLVEVSAASEPQDRVDVAERPIAQSLAGRSARRARVAGSVSRRHRERARQSERRRSVPRRTAEPGERLAKSANAKSMGPHDSLSHCDEAQTSMQVAATAALHQAVAPGLLRAVRYRWRAASMR